MTGRKDAARLAVQGLAEELDSIRERLAELHPDLPTSRQLDFETLRLELRLASARCRSLGNLTPGGHVPWTPRDSQTVRDMHLVGLSVAQISDRLGCSDRTVREVLRGVRP